MQSAAVHRRLDPFVAALPAGAATSRFPATVPWGAVAAMAAAINAACVAVLALAQHLVSSPAGVLVALRVVVAGAPQVLQGMWLRLQQHNAEKLSAADRTIMLVAVGSFVVCALDPPSALLGRVRGRPMGTTQTPSPFAAQRRNFWRWVFLLVSGAITAQLAGLACINWGAA